MRAFNHPDLQQRCFWHQIQHYKEPLLVFRPSKMIKSRHLVHRALVDLQLFDLKAGKCVSSFPHFRKVKCSDNVCNICAHQFVETNRPCLLTNLLSKHRTPPLQLKFQEQRDLLTHNRRTSLVTERETLNILPPTPPGINQVLLIKGEHQVVYFWTSFQG